MFKTLFSRMLVTYLTVTLGLLALLGITVSGMFQNQYIAEKETELRREAEEINTIIVTKYMDDDKRPVAKDELFTIVRKYDALLQLQFVDAKFGKVVFMDEESANKWTGSENLDITGDAKELIDGSMSSMTKTGMFKNLLNIPVMSLMRPMVDEDQNNIGAIFFHIDMSRTNDSIRQVYWDVLLSAFMAVLLAFLAVSYITGRMTKPITDMNKTVMRFSKGEFDVRVQVSTTDEVGQLGNSFNVMADEINTLEQSRRSFVANVSHELRSPLTSMRGFLEAMQDGTIPQEEYQKYLDIVVGENKRMTAMVNDLLDLARIESGQYVLNIEAFDINELILRTMLTFEARINTKKLDVSLEFSPERSFVEADQNQIAQVLRNLIDNAIKFTPDGGRLSVTTMVKKSITAVAVEDSGKGIPKEDIPYVFDRFYKAEKAHTPSGTSGTGLGLSIVKRIIEQHSQSITVTSSNQRTRFTFTLKHIQERVEKKRPTTEKH
ncbi:MAG: ATP-binding protein [Clostridia bacterium]